MFETKDVGGTGLVRLNDPTYKVSGDEQYLNPEKPTEAVYPLGTYVARNPLKGFAAPGGCGNGPRD